MPYGIKNETPEITSWMENCVDSINGTNKRTGKPYKEGEKISICKWNLKRHGWKVPKKSENGPSTILIASETLNFVLNLGAGAEINLRMLATSISERGEGLFPVPTNPVTPAVVLTASHVGSSSIILTIK